MELFETVKQIVVTHDAKRYQPIHISYPNWENPGTLYRTREEAEAWLESQVDRQRGDWGYVAELQHDSTPKA